MVAGMIMKRFNNDAERQTERRVNFRMRGLNTQGRPYQRHPNFVNQSESPSVKAIQKAARRKHILKVGLDRYHRIAAENRAKGLTTRGKPRKHQKPLKAEYRQLRELIAMPIVSAEDAYVATRREAWSEARC